MPKFFALLLVLLPASFLVAGQSVTTSDVKINITLIDTPSSVEISFLVEVTNLSGVPQRIVKNLWLDYRNNYSKPIGNLIIELQRKGNTGYALFSPTADIDWFRFGEDSFRILQPNNFILETVVLNGRSWGRKGLPAGDYRGRVYFNWSEWGQSLNHPSALVSFTIK